MATTKKVAASAAPAPEKKAVKKAVKAEPYEEQIFVQFEENEWLASDVVERAKAVYAAAGHRASSIKSLRLYIKPEEQKAYFVINGKMTGSLDI